MFFLDTYAMYEIIARNPNYEKFSNAKFATSILNLIELYYSLLKINVKFAEKFYDFFKKAEIKIDDETIQDAMKFKLENRKKKLSYADCIGYILARKKGMKFLTGDKEFKGMEGVEFVK